MKEVTGKYGTAKIFTDLVEDSAIEQVRELLNQKFVEGCKIRMMPDIHSGAGCVIGTTMEIKDRICPNLVGVDIGCGMLCVKLEEKESDIDLEKLDRVIHKYIPSGFNIRQTPSEYARVVKLNALDCYSGVDIDRAYKSLGTLGGGNHFIEIDKDDDGDLYLVIHTGSRHLGVEVAKYYQDWAETSILADIQNRRTELIEGLKAAGRQSEINAELNKLESSIVKPPRKLSSIGGRLFYSYLHDMEIVQVYATWNRRAIAKEIITRLGLHMDYRFETIHNYIDTDRMILRKGAVSAEEGELLLIPMNMRDGSLICRGKGNPDWNYSAPHGAGRLMSRMEARKQIDISDFKNSMQGIYTTSVSEGTLDECPMAYKPMKSIVENIGDTVDVLNVIHPVYNFKAES